MISDGYRGGAARNTPPIATVLGRYIARVRRPRPAARRRAQRRIDRDAVFG